MNFDIVGARVVPLRTVNEKLQPLPEHALGKNGERAEQPEQRQNPCEAMQRNAGFMAKAPAIMRIV